MKSLAPLAAILLAACGQPVSETAQRDPTPAQPPAPVLDPDAPPPLGPAETVELSADETWRQRIAGRWSQNPGCGGMTWNFQADSFTTPGETHCPQVAVTDGPGGVVRVTGSECRAEGSAQDDIVMDVALGDGTIDVTGVDNPIATPGWLRCE